MNYILKKIIICNERKISLVIIRIIVQFSIFLFFKNFKFLKALRNLHFTNNFQFHHVNANDCIFSNIIFFSLFSNLLNISGFISIVNTKYFNVIIYIMFNVNFKLNFIFILLHLLILYWVQIVHSSNIRILE